MDEQTHKNNCILWSYAEKLRLLVEYEIIDEIAYYGILDIAKKQLGPSIILPRKNMCCVY